MFVTAVDLGVSIASYIIHDLQACELYDLAYRIEFHSWFKTNNTYYTNLQI